MRRESSSIGPVGLMFVVIFLVFTTACEVKIWRECRQTNSFFYCLRMTR